jgi:hypothetical protein
VTAANSDLAPLRRAAPRSRGPVAPRLAWLVGLTWLTGCQAATVIELGTCDVSIASATPAVVQAGDIVVMTASPMTETWDTVAFVDGTPAEVVSVDRVGCKACDQCRVDAACTDCGDCDTCDRLCVEECVETVTVRVPEGPVGIADIWIVNGHGRAEGVTIDVLAGEDTGGIEGIETRR